MTYVMKRVTKDFGEIAIIDVDKPDLLKFKLIDWSAEGLRSLIER